MNDLLLTNLIDLGLIDSDHRQFVQFKNTNQYN
jgi:hypothetical protein